MGNQLQNPFSGGAVLYGNALNNINRNTIGDSITNLAQVNQRHDMQELLGNTDYANFSENQGQLGQMALGMNKADQASYANSAQQLQYDRVNRMNAYKDFFKAGKYHNVPASGSATGKNGGVSYDGGGASAGDSSQIHKLNQGESSSAWSPIVDRAKLDKNQGKALAAQNYRPGYTMYEKSFGEKNQDMTNFALGDMAKMFGFKDYKGGNQSANPMTKLMTPEILDKQTPKAKPGTIPTKNNIEKDKVYQSPKGKVRVTRLIDGDTVEIVDENGKSSRIRLQHLKSPEMKDAKTGIHSPESLDATANLFRNIGGELSMDGGNIGDLTNQTILSEYNDSGKTGPYGRRIGELMQGDRNINAIMSNEIEHGVDPRYPVDPNNPNYNDYNIASESVGTPNYEDVVKTQDITREGDVRTQQAMEGPVNPNPEANDTRYSDRTAQDYIDTQYTNNMDRLKGLYDNAKSDKHKQGFLNAIKAEETAHINRLKKAGIKADPKQELFKPNLKDIEQNSLDPSASASSMPGHVVISGINNKSKAATAKVSGELAAQQRQNDIDLKENSKDLNLYKNTGTLNSPGAKKAMKLRKQLEQQTQDILDKKQANNVRMESNEKNIKNAYELNNMPLDDDMADRLDNNKVFGVGGLMSGNTLKDMVDRLDRSRVQRRDDGYAFELPTGIGEEKIYMTGDSAAGIKQSMEFLLKSADSEDSRFNIYYDNFMNDLKTKSKGTDAEARRSGQMYNWYRNNVKDVKQHWNQDKIQLKD